MENLSFENLPSAVAEQGKKLDWACELLRQLIQNKPLVIERMNAPEAARYLNIALPTLYAYTSQRKIKCYKSGKKLSFLTSDLDQFLNEGQRKTADELANEALTKRRVKA